MAAPAPTLRVKPPRFLSASRTYQFELEAAPTFQVSVTHPTSWRSIPFQEFPSQQVALNEFLDGFCTQAAGAFTGGLRRETLLSRLSHSWTLEEVEEPALLDEAAADGQEIRTTWIPVRLLVKLNGIELVWTCGMANAVPPTIPPGFLAEVETVPTISAGLEAEAESPAPLVESEPPESALPASSAGEGRSKERQRIRQARLRATLAQLRAEQMAERYYRRYGTFELSDSDSELSDWGEEDSTAH